MKHNFVWNPESNAISSDDPNALERLKEKLAALEQWQEGMKAVNKIIKKHKGEQDQIVALMDQLDMDLGNASKLVRPDFCGRVGFHYHLTNNNGNMRRIKERIKDLEKLEQAETAEENLPGDVKLISNVEANRLQILFPGKPDEKIREKLKGRGFKWAPSEGAWQRHLTGVNVDYIKQWLTAILVEANG